MLECISVENMRNSDRYTIENYASGRELMLRAAKGILNAANWQGKIVIMAGSGNNGGDGFALAWLLKQSGRNCVVYTVSDKMSQDGAYYAEQARRAGVQIEGFLSGHEMLKNCDMIVDCLLGTGFHGEVREPYRLAIEEINASGAYVISADINSGMNGDTGAAETAVKSDLTVAIGYIKNGMMEERAGNYMRRLVCADIGIKLLREENKICTEKEWEKLKTEQRKQQDSLGKKKLQEGQLLQKKEQNIENEMESGRLIFGNTIYFRKPEYLIIKEEESKSGRENGEKCFEFGKAGS